jgi:hypothetical protein
LSSLPEGAPQHQLLANLANYLSTIYFVGESIISHILCELGSM